MLPKRPETVKNHCYFPSQDCHLCPEVLKKEMKFHERRHAQVHFIFHVFLASNTYRFQHISGMDE
jgi:hypothetical protein